MENMRIKSNTSPKISRSVINYIILIVSLAGIILTLTEIYLNLKGTSICKTEGCTVVHIFDIHNTLNYLGIFIFSSIFIFSLLKNQRLLILRSLILSICVIVEGYFIGFQAWYVKEFCHFCLTVAGFIFLLFFLDFLSSKHKTIGLVGITGFISLLISTYLVNMPLISLNLKYPVIIYQKNCPHCKAVIKYAKENQIKINTYEVKKVYPLIKILKFDSIPILIYKVNNNKIFAINGEKEIKNWLKTKIRKEASFIPNSSETLFPFEEGGACRIDQPNCE